MDFLNKQQTAYRYKLEGLNKHWIETDSDVGEAVYSLLPAGNYTFKAITKDHLGQWQEDLTAISLDIRVLPNWWQSWWAYCLYSLLLLAVISVIFWLYTRKIIADNAINVTTIITKQQRTPIATSNLDIWVVFYIFTLFLGEYGIDYLWG